MFEGKCDKALCHRIGSDAPDNGHEIQGEKLGQGRGFCPGAARPGQGFSNHQGAQSQEEAGPGRALSREEHKSSRTFFHDMETGGELLASAPDSTAVSREELLMPQVNAASDHRPLVSAGSKAQCNLPGQTLGSSSSSFFCLCPSPHPPHCRESRYVSERRLKSITCWLKSRLS